jgi:hypothetical protein
MRKRSVLVAIALAHAIATPAAADELPPGRRVWTSPFGDVDPSAMPRVPRNLRVILVLDQGVQTPGFPPWKPYAGGIDPGSVGLRLRGASSLLPLAHRVATGGLGPDEYDVAPTPPLEARRVYELAGRRNDGAEAILFAFETTDVIDVSAPTWSGVREAKFFGHLGDGRREIFAVADEPRDDTTPIEHMRFAIWSAAADGSFVPTTPELEPARFTSPRVTTLAASERERALLREIFNRPVEVGVADGGARQRVLHVGTSEGGFAHYAIRPMDLAGNLGTVSYVHIDLGSVSPPAGSWMCAHLCSVRPAASAEDGAVVAWMSLALAARCRRRSRSVRRGRTSIVARL